MNTHARGKTVGAPSKEGRALLTVADVRQLKVDLEADEKLLAELPARVEQKRKRYEAALMFVDIGVLNDISNVPVAATSDVNATQLVLTNPEERSFRATRDGELTWTGAIMKVLDHAKRGMTHNEIQAAIQTENPEFIEGKPYYNAMSKLDKRGEVIKEGALFYAAPNYKRLAALTKTNSPAESSQGKQLKEHTSAWFIYNILSESSGAMTANQIKEKLRKEEGVTPKLLTSNNFIFNILKSLLNDGLIDKNEETKAYFVASKKVKPRGNGAS